MGGAYNLLRNSKFDFIVSKPRPMKKLLNSIIKSKTVQGILLLLFQVILKNNGIEIPIIGDLAHSVDTGQALAGAWTLYGLRDAMPKPIGGNV